MYQFWRELLVRLDLLLVTGVHINPPILVLSHNSHPSQTLDESFPVFLWFHGLVLKDVILVYFRFALWPPIIHELD